MTLKEFQTLRHFRGTGRYVGKDAEWKRKVPKANMKLETLQALRTHGLLEFAWAADWFLTDAGRAFLKDPDFYRIEV